MCVCVCVGLIDAEQSGGIAFYGDNRIGKKDISISLSHCHSKSSHVRQI